MEKEHARKLVELSDRHTAELTQFYIDVESSLEESERGELRRLVAETTGGSLLRLSEFVFALYPDLIPDSLKTDRDKMVGDD